MNFLKLMHQGIADPSHSMANKGGGGSGSPYYENMDRLYGAQARAAEFMLDQSMPRIPEYMQNSQDMTNDAMSGALGNRLRDRAGADADAAAGNALATMNQNLASYGVNPNSGLFAGQNRKLAVSNAANKTMAMNQAGLAAEDQKWNRNAGALAQATGMGSGAMSGMSSAGSGYGQMAGQMANQDAANAQGFGQFGAAMAKSAFADGGEVIEGKAVRLASGGNAWEQYKAQNKLLTGGVRGNSVSPWAAAAAGAAPIVVGKGLKSAWNSDVVQDNVVKPVKEAVSGAFKSAWDKMTTDPVADLSKSGDIGSVGGSSSGLDSVNGTVTPDATSEVATSTPIAETVVDAVALDANPVSNVAEEYGKEWLADIGSGAGEYASAFTFATGGEVKMARGGMLQMSNAKAMKMPSISSMDASQSMKVSSEPAKISMPKVAKMGSASTEKETTNPNDAIRGGRYAYNSMEGASGAADMTTAGGEQVTQQTAEALGEAGLEQGSKQAAAIAAQDAGFEQAAEGADMGGAASAVKGVADIANGRDAGEAAADAAASYAGSQAGQAIGTAIMPGVGTVIGGALGGLLGGSLFADGGDVEREDFRPGGDVQGPGTETSDDIPAWLSTGEVVENADAVKMPVEETKAVIDQWEQEGGDTKGLLLAINDAGLEKRNAFACGGMAKHGVKLAGGGFLGGNLGIALGAGVQQWQRMNEEDRRASAEQRQQKADDRQQEMFDRQTKQYEQMEGFKTNMRDMLKRHAVESSPDSMLAAKTDEAKAAAEKIGQEYVPMTPEQTQVFKDNYKPDLQAQQNEMAQAFRSNLMFNEADAIDRKGQVKTVSDAVIAATKDNPVIQAVAPLDPLAAAKLYIGETDLNKRLLQRDQLAEAKRLHDLAMLERRIDAKMEGGGNKKSGSSGNSGSGGSSMKDTDIRAAYDLAIPDDGYSVAGADKKNPVVLTKGDIFAQASSRLGQFSKLNPGLDPHAVIAATIEATKFKNGIPSNGTVQFDMDGKGNFVPVIEMKDSVGSRKVRIGDPVPFNQIGSLDPSLSKMLKPEQIKKAEIEFNIDSLREAKVLSDRFSKMTPQQIAALDPQIRKRLENLQYDIPRLEQKLKDANKPIVVNDVLGDQKPAEQGMLRDKDGNIQLLNVFKPVGRAFDAIGENLRERQRVQNESEEQTWGTQRNW